MKLARAIVCAAALVSTLAFSSEQSMSSSSSQPKGAASSKRTSEDFPRVNLAYNDTSCMSRCDKQYDKCKENSSEMVCSTQQKKCYDNCK
jgi:hypothetical protein